MDKLKVCFVGIGSIARRHIKNLNYVCNKRGIELQIDAFRHCNCGNDEISGVNDVYYTLTETPEDYDAIFITNPTELHFMTMKQFHNKGKNFFIEKPVVNIQHIQEAFRSSFAVTLFIMLHARFGIMRLFNTLKRISSRKA